MINSLVNGIQKLFGNKADKDVKGLEPFVGKINTEFTKLEGLTNDELRGKTTSFKNQVNDYLSEIDKKIADLKSEIKNTTVHEIDKREDAYEQIDSLEEERDKKLEEILNQILPEAFAVVKETARRFTENDKIIASATEYDRDLAATKPHINIKNDEVVYNTTWDAAFYMHLKAFETMMQTNTLVLVGRLLER